MSEDIKAFIEEINRRTDGEIKKIISEAEEKAKKIIKEAEEEANKIFQHEASSRLKLLRRRILGKAEMDARKELINAKNEILEKIYQISIKKLEQIAVGGDADIDYHDILTRLIEEAIATLDEGEVIIEANERDKEYLSVNLRKIESELSRKLSRNIKLRLSNNTIDVLGGVIVYNPSRTKIYNNTLEGRLNIVFQKYRNILGKFLFK